MALKLRSRLSLAFALCLLMAFATMWQASAQPAREIPANVCPGGKPSPTGSLITLGPNGKSERRTVPRAVVNGQPWGGRWFSAGSRSYWHCHTSGQLLMVAEGRGRFQKRGEKMREVGVGGTEYAGPMVEHWHGAAADSEAQMLSVNFQPGGDFWLEPVSEDDYSGKGTGIKPSTP